MICWRGGSIPRLGSAVVAGVLLGGAWGSPLPAVQESGNPPQEEGQASPPASKAPAVPKTVKGKMQVRPGGPMEEVEVPVHPVPVDPPSVLASEAALGDDELVLGVALGSQAVAYPIRYLALYEVLDDRVGETPIAPTW